MQNFKQIVRSASTLLLASPTGQKPHIAALWNRVEFRVNEQKQTENDASVHPTEEAISLYPALLQKTPAQCDSIVIREFGKLILRMAGPHCQARWEKKLVLPGEKQ